MQQHTLPKSPTLRLKNNSNKVLAIGGEIHNEILYFESTRQVIIIAENSKLINGYLFFVNRNREKIKVGPLTIIGPVKIGGDGTVEVQKKNSNIIQCVEFSEESHQSYIITGESGLRFNIE